MICITRTQSHKTSVSQFSDIYLHQLGNKAAKRRQVQMNKQQTIAGDYHQCTFSSVLGGLGFRVNFCGRFYYEWLLQTVTVSMFHADYKLQN